MFHELWYFYLVFAFATAAPTTAPPATEHLSTTSTQSTNEVAASTNATVIENSSTPESTTLLRWRHDVSSTVHRLRGRIVLANTRAEGSEDWGLTADEAEMACDRIARYQSELTPHTLLSAIMRRLIPKRRMSKTLPMEGHLLSVGSGQEVIALSHLLSPLPSGAYWTGGKLVRYRVNSMKHNTYKDHIVLTWSDGRVGQPSVLGMTREDEEKLREGYNYCLALNLADAAWQARDCADLLPYACVITPRQVGFSNEAEGRVTMSFTTTASPQETETNNANEATTNPPTEATAMTTVSLKESTSTTRLQETSNTEKVSQLPTSRMGNATEQNRTSTAALLTAVQVNSDMNNTISLGGATESTNLSAVRGILQGGMIAEGITGTPEKNETAAVGTQSVKIESPVLERNAAAEGSVESGSATTPTTPTESALKAAGNMLQEILGTTESAPSPAGFTSPSTAVGSSEESELTSVPHEDESAAMGPEEHEHSEEI